MPEAPLATLPLDNQLTLAIFDRSRKMAADRWQVELVLEIEVPVSEAAFSGGQVPPAPMAALTAALGDSVRFAYRDRRTFVEAAEKERLVAEMQANLLAMAPRYYGHPDFAARLIAKKYRELGLSRG